MKFAWIGGLLVGAMLALTSCTQSEPIKGDRPTIKIGGSSEAYEVMEILTEAYAADKEAIEFKFFQPSQTSGGVQGVKDGVIDIGLTSRELTESEQDSTIQYRAIAHSPMLLATHETVSIKNLTTEQIKGIYSGQITNWQEVGGPDAEIILLDLPEDEAEKKLLRRHYLGDIKITSRAIVFSEDDRIIKALLSTPYSIGTVAKEDEISEKSIKILSMDGISASPESIAQGKYKLFYTIGIVFSHTPNPDTQDFINYIFSEVGQNKLGSSGYVLIQQQ
jgi:phosphate transport system substrate-binding protein